jgi:hypothetical protein
MLPAKGALERVEIVAYGHRLAGIAGTYAPISFHGSDGLEIAPGTHADVMEATCDRGTDVWETSDRLSVLGHAWYAILKPKV